MDRRSLLQRPGRAGARRPVLLACAGHGLCSMTPMARALVHRFAISSGTGFWRPVHHLHARAHDLLGPPWSPRGARWRGRPVHAARSVGEPGCPAHRPGPSLSLQERENPATRCVLSGGIGSGFGTARVEWPHEGSRGRLRPHGDDVAQGSVGAVGLRPRLQPGRGLPEPRARQVLGGGRHPSRGGGGLGGFLAGYDVAVDWPACSFYEELMQTFPEAPVILTVRDPASPASAFARPARLARDTVERVHANAQSRQEAARSGGRGLDLDRGGWRHAGRDPSRAPNSRC